MNILFLSASDRGGSGNSAYSIYRVLKNYHNCEFLVLIKESQSKDVIDVSLAKREDNILNRIFWKLKELMAFQEFIIDTNYDMINLVELTSSVNQSTLYSFIRSKPDLIILNWVSGFINSSVIRKLYKKYNSTFLWILHDFAPLTGGCHITWDCNGFMDSCGKCPGIRSSTLKDKTFYILKRKLRNLKDVPIFVTGWSNFILNKSRKSKLFINKTLTSISPTINSLRFTPSKDKLASKKLFNIPNEIKVVLFGSQNISSRYKGFDQLVLALNRINKYTEKPNSFILLTFGRVENAMDFACEYPIKNIGEINNVELAFQAADVFVAPTLQDTGPMTVCESLMSGVPVVGYAMGIIPDIIEENETGFVVEKNNIEILSEKIAEILNLSNSEYQRISANCRRVAEEKFSEEAQLQSFIKLFKLMGIKDNP
jgi:glycosyltransferase involved in cell wall biosynthesis